MKLHVWLLSLPVVECNSAEWANAFLPHRVFVTILSMNQQLEGVEKEHDAHHGQGGWQKVSSSEVFFGVDVEAGEQPDNEEAELEQDNVTIVPLVVRDLSGSSHSPGNKWIGQD